MINSPSNILEVCANGYNSAIAAQLGGAHRVELCDNLNEGGTTPSFGQLKLCLEKLSIPVVPIIRPRGGDFNYSTVELDIMIQDILAFKSINCTGIVIGALNNKNQIHKEYTKILIEAAGSMEVAFHRAFDRTPNLFESLDILIDLNIKRVLTSGGQKTAFEGISTIQKLVKQADQNIEIMPGSGVNESNILFIKEQSGAANFHTTAKSINPKPTTSIFTDLIDDYPLTDVNVVKQILDKLNPFL